MAERKLSQSFVDQITAPSSTHSQYGLPATYVPPPATAQQSEQMISRLVELIELQREDLAQTNELVRAAQAQTKRAEADAKESRRDARINMRFAWAALIATAAIGVVQVIQAAVLA